MENQSTCGKCDNLTQEIEKLKEQLRQKKKKYQTQLQAHEALYQDFKLQLDNQNELKKEIENLQLRLSNSEQSDQERIRQLQKENERLKKSNEDKQNEISSRDSALDKGQVLIRKLNEECETAAKKLEKSEKQIAKLKKEIRKNEKQFTAQAKQMESFDTLKRTEERLRVENSKLKEE